MSVNTGNTPNTQTERVIPGIGSDTGVRITATGSDAETLLDELVRPWIGEGAPQADPAIPPVELGELQADFLERTASQLSSLVTQASLAHHGGKMLLLHAAGIARDDGNVAVLIGPSGRGKTTTVRMLAQHYGYVSDETIAIEDDGRVLPYRKPLSVITEGHVDKLQIAPAELRLRPLPDAPLTFSSFVLLERGDGGDSTVDFAPLGEGITTMLEQSSYLLEMEDPLRRIAEFVTQSGGIRRLRAGDPERIIDVAEQLFAQEKPAAEKPATEKPANAKPADGKLSDETPGNETTASEESATDRHWQQVLPVAAASTEAQRFTPGDVVDAIECPDGTVVFTRDRRAQLLTGVGPVVWRGVCAGDDWQALIERVVGEVGAPPEGDAESAVERVCEQLVEAGVLVGAEIGAQV